MTDGPAELSVARAFEIAIAHHRSGRLTEAESLCRQVLARVPDQTDCLNLLVQLLHQSGRGSEAIDLLRRATEANPGVADHHANLGVILAQSGNFAEAISTLRHAVALRP